MLSVVSWSYDHHVHCHWETSRWVVSRCQTNCPLAKKKLLEIAVHQSCGSNTIWVNASKVDLGHQQKAILAPWQASHWGLGDEDLHIAQDLPKSSAGHGTLVPQDPLIASRISKCIMCPWKPMMIRWPIMYNSFHHMYIYIIYILYYILYIYIIHIYDIYIYDVCIHICTLTNVWWPHIGTKNTCFLTKIDHQKTNNPRAFRPRHISAELQSRNRPRRSKPQSLVFFRTRLMEKLWEFTKKKRE
jgi:hypothetical protein